MRLSVPSEPTLSFQDRVGKPTSGRQVAVIDPNCQAIAFHLYAGLLKVVPLELDSGQPLKAFNLRSVFHLFINY